ncbi:MAG: flagellar hook-basal body complex protein FliE [Bordetella sp.]|nr:flagellar hook-basal body complex protein FliE [Bordetella sp.]
MIAITPVELAALSPSAIQLLQASQGAAQQTAQAAAAGTPGLAAVGAAGPTVPAAAATFPAMVSQGLVQGLSQVNGQLIGSQQALQKFALGEGGSLHQMMIDMEESRMSFQLMLQVRTRLLEAYQDLMKMPL